MAHTIHLKDKDNKQDHIPKYSKAIADKYVSIAGNVFKRFEQLERNRQWVKKVRSNQIDQGILIFADHKKQEKLEKLNKLLTEFSKPQIKKGKKVWTLGRGMNPFLAMYIDDHKYEMKKQTWRVRKCLR